MLSMQCRKAAGLDFVRVAAATVFGSKFPTAGLE